MNGILEYLRRDEAPRWHVVSWRQSPVSNNKYIVDHEEPR